MLSPNLLELLRDWWRAARKKGWMPPGPALAVPRLPRTAHERAPAPPHRSPGCGARRHHQTRRCSYAAPPGHSPGVCHASPGAKDRYPAHPEPAPAQAGVLLGHKKLDTTALYTRVAIKAIGEVTSPLDLLAERGEATRLTNRGCHGQRSQRSRWRTSSAAAGQLGVRLMPVM
jgi:integrase/recombinase XerD